MGKGKGTISAADLLGGTSDWSFGPSGLRAFGPSVSVSGVRISDEELEELEREISR